MKKTLTLIIALFAIVSQSATIDWKIGTTRNTYLFDSTGDKFTGTVYLIHAGQLTDLLSGSFADLQSNLTSMKLDSVSLSNGSYAVASKTAPTEALTSGTSYDFQLMFLDVDAEKYALSASQSKPAYTPNVDPMQQISFGQTQVGAAGTAAQSTLVWKSIPEPATGALALAGLALLFRRKRA